LNQDFWRETAAKAYIFAVLGAIAVDSGWIFYVASRTLLDKENLRDLVD
jgi:hypothetical protein